MQNDVLTNTNKRERMQMASNGEDIEALIEKNEPEVISELIKNGYAQTTTTSGNHTNMAVRHILAYLGFFSTPKCRKLYFNPRTRVGHDRALLPRLRPHWFSRCSKYPTLLSNLITGPLFLRERSRI